MNREHFRILTGYLPFPWQEALYSRFASANIPKTVCIPTGLGKTNVVALWLLALMNHPDSMPRRLVYVVNRRTVVDQTTAEVERLRKNLAKLHHERLKTLAISTLRGQFADNREWSADPSQPAVICGTVDMIGSRLLFTGYGVGFKAKPLHAGFLGQDALLVHDEAHLEPAFQKLIKSIENQQERCSEFANFTVMELTATTRSGGQDEDFEKDVFGLSDEDYQHDLVEKRINAPKLLTLTPVDDDKQLAGKIAQQAIWRSKNKDENGNEKDADAPVLVFVRRLEDVKNVYNALQKGGIHRDHIAQLTGTMRGLERDAMAERDPVFMRFLAEKNRNPEVPRITGTVYLICTSAGEVGIDISADHMICDLSTFDSMAQRFGRVNRYGEHNDTRIDLFYPKEFGKKDKKDNVKVDELDLRRKKTLELLKKLPSSGIDSEGNPVYDASPNALSNLRQSPDLPCRLEDAFAPEPIILPATDILFDAWSLTTIRTKMPGRPPVEPYLHGIREWEPPRTSVAWREEVSRLNTEKLLANNQPEDLLENYPLKPHELLSDTSKRVMEQLGVIHKRLKDNDCPIWLVDERGEVEVLSLGALLAADKKQATSRISGSTILLPPSAGGLSNGMLDGSSPDADDVADVTEGKVEKRVRVMSDDVAYYDKTDGMRMICSIKLNTDDDEAGQCTWDWYKLKPLEDTRTAQKPVLYETHVGDVEREANRILENLSLRDEHQDCRHAARSRQAARAIPSIAGQPGLSEPRAG